MKILNPSIYTDFDGNKAVMDLSNAIKFKTVSYIDLSKYDYEEFNKLHNYLKKTFPLLTSKANVEVVNNGSIIFHLKGTNSTLKPAIFMAHLDVVPVVKGTEEDWTYDAFSGHIDEKYVWGRGSLDTKCMVIGELSAIEYLLSKGFTPKRDIYFCYGHDEETQGVAGQWAISRLLKERGVEAEYVIDEGAGFVSAKKYGAPNITINPVGVFEKGYLDVKVTAKSLGGHSSNPGKGSSLAYVCKAVAKIEENQFEPFLPKALKDTFIILKDFIEVEPLKTYINDIDKYEKELIDYCYNDYGLNPFVHTTVATTMLDGGSQGANVLPQTVVANINLRTSERDSIPSIIAKYKEITENVEISYQGGLEPSLSSDISTYGFKLIESTVNKFVDDVKVVPVLICGGTDARYYDDLTTSSFRFTPYIYSEELSSTVHATNERIEKEGFIYGIKIFIDLIKESC
jgi:carboxypeptidase PM20D1